MANQLKRRFQSENYFTGKSIKILKNRKMKLVLVVLMAFVYSAHSAVLPPNADAVEPEVGSEIKAEDLMRSKQVLEWIANAIKFIGSPFESLAKNAKNPVASSVRSVGNSVVDSY
jgi:hypothetical protein